MGSHAAANIWFVVMVAPVVCRGEVRTEGSLKSRPPRWLGRNGTLNSGGLERASCSRYLNRPHPWRPNAPIQSAQNAQSIPNEPKSAALLTLSPRVVELIALHYTTDRLRLTPPKKSWTASRNLSNPGRHGTSQAPSSRLTTSWCHTWRPATLRPSSLKCLLRSRTPIRRTRNRCQVRVDIMGGIIILQKKECLDDCLQTGMSQASLRFAASGRYSTRIRLLAIWDGPEAAARAVNVAGSYWFWSIKLSELWRVCVTWCGVGWCVGAFSCRTLARYPIFK